MPNSRSGDVSLSGTASLRTLAQGSAQIFQAPAIVETRPFVLTIVTGQAILYINMTWQH
jgi:hypothetical protein